jgi:hypothetical protein
MSVHADLSSFANYGQFWFLTAIFDRQPLLCAILLNYYGS